MFSWRYVYGRSGHFRTILTGLTVADLDENYQMAQTCWLKAYNKKRRQPVSIRHKFDIGTGFIEEIKSWVDYYFREEHCGAN